VNTNRLSIRCKPTAAARGFSLIEVLVALVVLGIGLLGITKLQALAYASTDNAANQSVASVEAASFAASMRANRAYWAQGGAPNPIMLAGTTVTSTDATLNAAMDCTSGGANAPCVPHDLAAYDLQKWAAALQAILPNYAAQISCPPLVSPVDCTIQLTWNERTVNLNTQSVAGPAIAQPVYILNVQP
jgi:type IV pilus assembly protein PilV